LLQYRSEPRRFAAAKLRQCSQMPSAADQHFEWPNCPEGHQHNKCLIRNYDPRALARLQFKIIAEQTSAVALEIAELRRQFARGRLWNRFRRPYLAMRMRIASAHHLAAVFENLHMANSRYLAELFKLSCPGADYFFDSRQIHAGERQIMTGGEAHHAANSRLTFGYHQAFVLHVHPEVRRIFPQRSEIIFEDERRTVFGVARPARAWVPGAKVAGRVVARTHNRRNCLDRALPWTPCPMRRNQHPLIG